jgi:hypothetical protein
METPIVYGLEFKTAKSFNSREEANNFLKDNEDYGCLSQTPEFGDNPTQVWCCRLDDRGSPVSKK